MARTGSEPVTLLTNTVGSNWPCATCCAQQRAHQRAGRSATLAHIHIKTLTRTRKSSGPKVSRNAVDKEGSGKALPAGAAGAAATGAVCREGAAAAEEAPALAAMTTAAAEAAAGVAAVEGAPPAAAPGGRRA